MDQKSQDTKDLNWSLSLQQRKQQSCCSTLYPGENNINILNVQFTILHNVKYNYVIFDIDLTFIMQMFILYFVIVMYPLDFHLIL